MLEYLKYLEENFGEDFREALSEDDLLAIAVYDEESEKEQEMSVYSLINGYLNLCKEVKDKYNNLFKNMDKIIKEKYVKSKIGILIKSMKIDSIYNDNDIYSFTLSAQYPINFSIRLHIEGTYYNNEKDSTYILKKSDNEPREYELSLEPDECDMRAIAMAGIFNEWVDLKELYQLVESMYQVNKQLIYTPHSSRALPVSITLSNAGEVSLSYTGGNNATELMSISSAKSLYMHDDYRIKGEDIQRNFSEANSYKIDPIWVLKNMYVFSKDVPRELERASDYPNSLRDIFRKYGYGKSLSQVYEYGEVRNQIYFMYGNNNELIEITNISDVEVSSEYYEFTFIDGSKFKCIKDKIVVVDNGFIDYNLRDSEAVKNLHKKNG